MPSHTTCEQEIESLHTFFVDWYGGNLSKDSYERLGHALGPSFEMVTPEGARRERSEVIEGIRDNYDTHSSDSFDIEIRNVELRFSTDSHALVRYEEWQQTPTETTGRLSTVLFEKAPDAPGNVVWLDLHETWLDEPASE